VVRFVPSCIFFPQIFLSLASNRTDQDSKDTDHYILCPWLIFLLILVASLTLSRKFSCRDIESVALESVNIDDALQSCVWSAGGLCKLQPVPGCPRGLTKVCGRQQSLFRPETLDAWPLQPRARTREPCRRNYRESTRASEVPRAQWIQ
jgi:hypothetical protein